MSKLVYLSTATFENCEIDLATGTPDELDQAYTSLLDRSDSGGAFPGSKAWAKAKTYRDQLDILIHARPEIKAYRAARIEAELAARVADVNIFTN